MKDKFDLRKFLTEGEMYNPNEGESPKPVLKSVKDKFLEYGTQAEIDQYLTSLGNDMGKGGDYQGWTVDDFIEDFRNFVNDKGLDEIYEGMSKWDDPAYPGEDNGAEEEDIYKDGHPDEKEYEPFDEGAEEQTQFEGEELYGGEYRADERWGTGEDADQLDRMDGLANIKDFKTLQDLIRIQGTDWMEEGFDKEDIKLMLNFLVDEM